MISVRPGNTELLSSRDSLTSQGEQASLALVGSPFKAQYGGTSKPTLRPRNTGLGFSRVSVILW